MWVFIYNYSRIMNYKGKVIHKYLNDRPEKTLKREKMIHGIQYEHHERMEKLILRAFVLASRDKIKKISQEAYGKLKSPKSILPLLYVEEGSGFFTADILDMGFQTTDKDWDLCIKNKMHIEHEFILYGPDLEKEMLEEVVKVFNSIDSKTMSMF